MQRTNGALQSRIWKANVPNKIKIFSWRACLNILPTQENLVRRRVVEEARCCFCQNEAKLVLHVLWGCGATQDVWAGSSSRFQKSSTTQVDFLQLVTSLMPKLSGEEWDLFWVTCWQIWHQRNTVMHGGVFQHPSRSSQQALDYLKEYSCNDPRKSASHIYAIPQKDQSQSRLLTVVYKARFNLVNTRCRTHHIPTHIAQSIKLGHHNLPHLNP